MSNELLRDLETVEADPFEITNRDRALFLIEEYDLEAQLLAIRSLLKRNSESDKSLQAEIKALEAEIRKHSDDYADYLQDSRIDHLHGSVFQDAAHSMSAVGMLAPFVESLFVAVFEGLRASRPPEDDATEGRVSALHDAFWDPHYVFEGGQRRKHVVKGIRQLSECTGLIAYLPDNLFKTLSALFEYRNRMFHNGFEWPIDQRETFAKSILQNQWPSNWFTRSSSGGKPWIFYMSSDFIRHCLATVDQILDGVGRYLSSGDDAKLDKTFRLRNEESWQEVRKIGDVSCR